jgi:hypothetical protein
LEAGQEVEFDVVAGIMGSKAVGVTLVDGYLVESDRTVRLHNLAKRGKFLLELIC